MVLPITIIPSPLLRRATRALTRKELQSSDIQKLIDDMIHTMPAAGGIGLAAPQVNKDQRITVIATDAHPLVVINGKIIEQSHDMEDGEEGCLSIPGVYGIVPRHARIRASFLDRRGKKITLRAQGLLARVFQHELDHLDGILFVDRTDTFTSPVSEEQKKMFAAYKLN